MISRQPELRRLIEGVSFSGTSISERCKWLEPLVVYEQSVIPNAADHLVFYCAVAYKSLTDAFVLTQRQAALRRIATSKNPLSESYLNKHSGASRWISVGISHLTTSRQYLEKPVVLATPTPTGWTVSGTVPWVTAASNSQALVIAACDSEDFAQQYLFYLPMDQASVQPGNQMELLALSESNTCEVHLRNAQLSQSHVLHGPSTQVMSISQSSGAGGLQTTALALGLAACVIDKIHSRSGRIPTIIDSEMRFTERWRKLFDRMIAASETNKSTPELATIRKDANDLVLRTSQAALAIEKGAGFLVHSDAARWAREALFFLVWSCPQAIANEHLCDLSSFH
ncbi:MAG: hypothetical protein ACKOAU_19900 [Pirellula sp.]